MKIKRGLKISAIVLMMLFVGGAGWYYRFIYSYERWFDTHLVATVWTPMKEKELAEILHQRFRYCGKGSTSGAYVSEDGQFVLKTFLKKEFRSKTGQSIPIFRELANKRKELRSKYNRVFGPINAYQYIPQESGMIYYQFIRPTHRFHHLIQLTEKDGSISWLDPNRDEYVIQKKAVLAQVYLQDYVARGDLERAKNGIVQLLEMTKTLYAQEIVLVALQFLNNFGFVNDEPIRIDVEHVRFDPKWKKKGRAHFRKEVAKFRNWVESEVPVLLSFFDETVERLEINDRNLD
jgi:hypothetical protein